MLHKYPQNRAPCHNADDLLRESSLSRIGKSEGMNAFKAIVLLCQMASHKVVPLVLGKIFSTKIAVWNSMTQKDLLFYSVGPLPVSMF